jgi:hypothetical protein
LPEQQIATLDGLVDALDRVLDSGASVVGDVIVSVADVDLIRVDLRLLLAGIQGQPEGAAS